MKRIVAYLLLGISFSGCGALKKDYQTYDRSHDRRVDVSYDSDTRTWDLGYTITPVNPVGGYAK